ncbi:cell wall elongation regulator TseB-like domain-containing protein [Bacillus massiliigorillae]|uniref:cell wall elongation regulator TseB-like domain-containing protein n=1 Tax=Bacillus massiliigorillae TaxID=1243664 RepID=UPI0012B66F1C|nr:DUF5590 domain-containing protein [Bacillus massiliigorillae]
MSILILLMIGYVIASILVGIHDKKTAEERAVSIAMDEGGLKSVSDFYLYHGKEVYSVVVGKDDKGISQVLWIPEKLDKNSTIIKKKYSEGKSEKEIINLVKQNYNPEEIISVKLGMENKSALWEVTFKDAKGNLHYYYYDFVTGDKRKTTIKGI